jgi:hypothetical protein
MEREGCARTGQKGISDVRTGKEVTSHHSALNSLCTDDIVKEHLPPNHREAMWPDGADNSDALLRVTVKSS